jgi:hypothetical protein
MSRKELSYEERDDLRILAAMLYRHALNPVDGVTVDFWKEYDYIGDAYMDIGVRVSIPMNVIRKSPYHYEDSLGDKEGLESFTKSLTEKVGRK